MKKFLVIGNPIDHSLSPKLHNYWIKQNKIDAVYEKQKLEDKDLESIDIKKLPELEYDLTRFDEQDVIHLVLAPRPARHALVLRERARGFRRLHA